MFKEAIVKELLPYHILIEKKIDEAILGFGPKNALRDACAYSLKNGGKRFRPALVLIIAKALGKGLDATDGALAVEFFHTASLIADDLPCMDDDDERRNQPSLHIAFGESTALLASYSLISAGYDRIRLNSSPEILPLAIESASLNTGILGLSGGQYLDIFTSDINEKTLKEILHKKTGALFELSFVLGWLFGGGDLAALDLVKKAAGHFGTSFQIVDDFLDLAKDKKEGRQINAPLILGEEKALAWLSYELSMFEQALEKLNLQSKELAAMAEALSLSHAQVAAASSSS